MGMCLNIVEILQYYLCTAGTSYRENVASTVAEYRFDILLKAIQHVQRNIRLHGTCKTAAVHTVCTITCKQFFLLACMNLFQGEAPTVQDLAQVMGSSHQNVKQIFNSAKNTITLPLPYVASERNIPPFEGDIVEKLASTKGYVIQAGVKKE